MPLARKRAFQQHTADANDVLSGHVSLGNAGPGTYRVWCVAAAAADAQITINDGNSIVVNAEAIPVRAAAVTYPEIRKNEDPYYEVIVPAGKDRPIINILDGTNAEIVLLVEKVA